jgi:aryl-alcohol dehydrogenase-like predicted oxidoreductase
LHLVLFHRESDAAHLDILEQMKFEGKLLHAGVSCDNQPGAAMNLTDDSRVSALQLPGNILDRRHQTSQVFRQAQTRNIAVFIRSVFLQGLLALSQNNIPEKLREIIPVRKSLERIAAEAGIKLTELAARYMLSQSGVTSILVGVETVDQVNANLEMFSGDVLPADILSAIDLLKIELSETILTPSMW